MKGIKSMSDKKLKQWQLNRVRNYRSLNIETLKSLRDILPRIGNVIKDENRGTVGSRLTF